MNPNEQAAPEAATITPEIQSILDQAVERTLQQMESSHPYGLGKYTDEDAAALGIDSLGSLRLANQLVKAWAGSPMIPRWIQDSPNPAGTFVACVLRGKELGFKMMESLSALYMSPDGRLGMYGTAMISLMRKSGISLKFSIITDEDGKEIGMEVYGKRKDGDDYTSRFTLADALRAKLSRVHVTYPIWMCKWRALSDLFRTLASDLAGGPLYTAEELSEDEKAEGREVVESITGKKQANPYMANMPMDEQDRSGAEAPLAPQAVASTAEAATTATATPAPSAPEPAEDEDDPTTEKNKSTFQKMLDAFADQKKRLGDITYYRLLKEHAGIEKSNQFRSMEEARRVYAKLHHYELPTKAEPQKAAEVEKGADPAKPPTPTERLKTEVEALALLYPKKSVPTVTGWIKNWLKGFYGGNIPAPKADNIDAIFGVLKIVRALLTECPQRIFENAEHNGKAAGIGYRKYLEYLEGRSLEAKAAFWLAVLAKWPEIGGDDGTELEAIAFMDFLKLDAKFSDTDFSALFRVIARKPNVPVGNLLHQAKVTGVPVHKIVAGWGIDLAAAPVGGIEALLIAAGKAEATVPEAPAAPESTRGPEPVKEDLESTDSDSWLE